MEITQGPVPPVATSSSVLPGNLGPIVSTFPNSVATGYTAPPLATYATVAATAGTTMPGIFGLSFYLPCKRQLGF